MSFCNAIKVSNLPELCLFADVSEEKVSIYSMLLNDFEVGLASSVRGAYHLVHVSRLAGSILTSGTFFRGDLVMKKILRPFSPFRCFKKGSCQLLAKEYASTCKLSRRLAQEVWIGWLTNRAQNDL